MPLVLTDSISDIKTLSDISYPLSPTFRTYTTTISPNQPSLSLSPTSYNIKTTISPPYTTTLSPTLSTSIVGIAPSNVSLLAVKPTVYVDIDTGLNDSYVVQKDVTKYFMFKTLDKWIYTEFPSVLKYLVYKDGKVTLIKNIKNKDTNDVSKDGEKALEAKADYIENKILSESKTRAILIRIMKELGLKWFELPYRENLVKEVMERYLKSKLKKMVMGVVDDDDL
jgi:hypothetical protein